MAAESPKRTMKYSHTVIRPHAFSDKSVMESVVDFISDVVPQAYCGNQKIEDKEKIQWVRFENTDGNDLANNPDFNSAENKGIPLLLILGYSNGVQIWHIMPNGEAQEAMSLRQGPIKILRVLPTPTPVFTEYDPYSVKRPLAAICDTTSAGQPYCSVKFVSLRTGDEVHNVSFKTLTVQGIECNKRVMVVVFQEKLCVFDSCSLTQLFWVTSCFPSTGPNYNPVALGTRWLAYADKRLVPLHQSCGGMSGDGAQSYAATVISAAKGAFKGLTMFGEAIVSNVTGTNYKPAPPTKKVENVVDNGHRPGIVSVIDVQSVSSDHFSVTEENECEGLIAHFHAHANEPVAAMNFDVTGTLLLTACKLGHNFHVFRIMAHPCSSSLGAVHHLYTLHRGDTTAKVIDMSFSQDSRWVTVNTHRGTTHVFPITPYGGTVNLRTHCSPRVVNRASRYHKSAGLDETDYTTSARRSPVLSGSPGSSAGQYDNYPSLMRHNAINNSMGNPRLPPFPHPTTIYPLAQIKQPLNLVTTIGGTKTQSPTHSATGTDNIIAVSSCFCTPRLWVGGSPNLSVDKREERRAVDSLFVVNHLGTVVEYVLEPKPKTAASEKISDETMLDLGVTGYTQWHLQRSKTSDEVKPPLANNNPLMLAADAVRTQQPTSFQDLGELAPVTRHDSKDSLSSEHSNKDTDIDEQWLSQVEIFTHVGPHRRLWMGPQFAFKTYQNVQNTTVLSSNSSALLSQSPEANVAAMDIVTDECDLESLKIQPTRSSPVAMPNSRPAYRRQAMGSDSTPPPGKGPNTPLLIEAGSFDQSPNLCDVYSSWAESTVAKQPRGSEEEEDRIKETLAEAMLESPLKEGGPPCIRNGSKVSSERELGKSTNEKGRKKNGKKLSALSSVKELSPSETPEGSKKKCESLNRLDSEKSKSVASKKDETEDLSMYKPEQEENVPCEKVESDKASNIASKKSKKNKKGKDACKTSTEKVTDVKVSSDKNVEKSELQESKHGKDVKDTKTTSEKMQGKDVQVKPESMKEGAPNLEKEKEHRVKLSHERLKTSKASSDVERMQEDRLKTVSVETTKNLVKMVDKCTEIVQMVDKGTEMELKLETETTDRFGSNKKAEKIRVSSDDAGEQVFVGQPKGKSLKSKTVELSSEALHDVESHPKVTLEKVKKTEQEQTKLGSSVGEHESADELKTKTQSGKQSKKKQKQRSVTDSVHVKEQAEDIDDKFATSDGNTNESANSVALNDDKNADKMASNLKSDVDKIERKIGSKDSCNDVKNVTYDNIDLKLTDADKKADESLGWDLADNGGKRSKSSKHKKASSPTPQVTTEENISKNNIESKSEKGRKNSPESSGIVKKEEGSEYPSLDTAVERTKSNKKKESSPVLQAKSNEEKVLCSSSEHIPEKKAESTDIDKKEDEHFEWAPVENAGKRSKSRNKKSNSPAPQTTTIEENNLKSNNVEPVPDQGKQNVAQIDKAKSVSNETNSEIRDNKKSAENKKSEVDPGNAKNTKVISKELYPIQSDVKSESRGKSDFVQQSTEMISKESKQSSSLNRGQDKETKTNVTSSCDPPKLKEDNLNISPVEPSKCEETIVSESNGQKEENGTEFQVKKSGKKGKKSGAKTKEVKPNNDDSEQNQKKDITEKLQDEKLLHTQTNVSSGTGGSKKSGSNDKEEAKKADSEETQQVCLKNDVVKDDDSCNENGDKRKERLSEVPGSKLKESAESEIKLQPSKKWAWGNVSSSNNSTKSNTAKSKSENEEFPSLAGGGNKKKDLKNEDEFPSLGGGGTKKKDLKNEDEFPSLVGGGTKKKDLKSEDEFPSLGGGGIKKKDLKNEDEFPSLGGGGIKKKDLKNEDEFPSLAGGGTKKKDLKNEDEFPSLVGGGTKKKDLKNEDEFPSLAGGGTKDKKGNSAVKNAWGKIKSGRDENGQVNLENGQAKDKSDKMKSENGENDKVTPKQEKEKNKSVIEKTETSCDMNISIKEDNGSKCTARDKVEKKSAWGSVNKDDGRDKRKDVTEMKTNMDDDKSINHHVKASLLGKEVEVKRPMDEVRKESSLETKDSKGNDKSVTSSSNSKSETVCDVKDELSSAGNNSPKKKTKGRNKKDKTSGKSKEDVNTESRESSPVSDVEDIKGDMKNESTSDVKNDSTSNVKNESTSNVKNESTSNVKNESTSDVKNESTSNVKSEAASYVNVENRDKNSVTELDMSKENGKGTSKPGSSNFKSNEEIGAVSSSTKTEKHKNNQKANSGEEIDAEMSGVNAESIVETKHKVKLESSSSNIKNKSGSIDTKFSSEEEEDLGAKSSSKDNFLTSEIGSSSSSGKDLSSRDEDSSSSKEADIVDNVEVNSEVACSGTQKRESTPESQSGKNNGSGKRNGKNKKKNKKGW